MPSKLLKNIETIRQERKSESVIRQMRDAINRGELAPGVRLPSEPLLAESFGVSRTVIREAVRVLETGGYLEVRRGSAGGTFIAERAPDELRPAHASPTAPFADDRHLLDARLSLEPALLRTAACRTPRDAHDLRAALAQGENQNATPARLTNGLANFHVTLSHLSGNPLLIHFMAQLVVPIRTSISARVRNGEWVAEHHRQHHAIVQAIEERDIERAVTLMASHLVFEHGAEG